MKRKSVKTIYSGFVKELKSTDPGKWYEMAKQIGAIGASNKIEVKVEVLEGIDNAQGAELIAEQFASTCLSACFATPTGDCV